MEPVGSGSSGLARRQHECGWMAGRIRAKKHPSCPSCPGRRGGEYADAGGAPQNLAAIVAPSQETAMYAQGLVTAAIRPRPVLAISDGRVVPLVVVGTDSVVGWFDLHRGIGNPVFGFEHVRSDVENLMVVTFRGDGDVG